MSRSGAIPSFQELDIIRKVPLFQVPFNSAFPYQPFIQKVMHTVHSLFHRLVFANFLHIFLRIPYFRRFPHFSAAGYIFRRIFMQNVSCIQNKIRKTQEPLAVPAFLITVFHRGWTWLRRRSAPCRRYCLPGIRNRPGSRSWQRCHRTGSGAAGRPARPAFRQQPKYPGG